MQMSGTKFLVLEAASPDRQTDTVWGFLSFFDTYFITVTLALILRRSKKVWRLAIDFDRPPPARSRVHVFLVSKPTISGRRS